MSAAPPLAAPLRVFVAWFVVFAFSATVSLSAPAERVLVRAGIHKEFGRLVFDWSHRVKYSVTINNRILTVRFDQDFEPDFGKILEDLDPYIRSVRLGADKRTVVIGLIKDFTLRTLVVDNHVVVDLFNATEASKTGDSTKAAVPPESGSWAASPAAPKNREGERIAATPADPASGSGEKENPGPETLVVRTGYHENYGRLVFGWTRKIGFDVEREGQKVTIKFDAAARVDIDKLRTELPRQIEAAVVQPSREGLELGFIVPSDAQLRYFHNNTDVVFDVVTKREEPAVRPVARRKTDRETPEGGAKRKKKTRPQNYPFVSVRASQRGAATTLRFNWRRPVSAAVFRRGSSLWIFFDQPARLDMGPIQAVGNSRFRKAAQSNQDSSVHLHLPLPKTMEAVVRRAGTVWVLEIGPRRRQRVREFPLVVRSAEKGGTALLIEMENPGGFSTVRDETVGDFIYAVPVYSAGRGIRGVRQFPDFEILRSSQGIAIRPIDDSVHLKQTPAGIVVTKPGGLLMSAEETAAIKRRDRSNDDVLVDLKAWRLGPADDFLKVEHELVQHVLRPPGVRRNSARLGLARFYVSHGLGAEAVGVLSTILKDSPELLRDRKVRVLRGLANYLVGHYADAEADLAHSSLAGRRELYPWRAGIAAARGDWAGAYRLFVDTDVALAALPTEFAVKLGLLAAEAALSVKEKEIAEARLAALETLPAVGGQLDQIAYLNGHLHKLKGNPAKAIVAWEMVENGGVRPMRAKAAFARITTLLETGAIQPYQAIDQLRKLQFAWRDSVFEFDLLNKLGELHAQQRNLRSALVTLRRAVTLFKGIKGAQSLTQRMGDLFRKFYLEGEADHLQPVVALGLFNEFRELTPPGEDGDKMISGLAERLIKVDLLGDAAQLLDHQVRFRLKGEQRARAGARLAEILLLDGKPQEALTALSISEHDGLPPPLSQKRRHLEAAALTDSHRYDEALNNIAQDFSQEFDMLRAQIYWRAEEWKKASRVLARLTGGLDAENLNERGAELLLRRAVALGLANDFAGMKFLRDRFGVAMEKSKQAASFKAVAGGKLLKPKNFAALARRAGELDTFRAFMKSSGGNGSDADDTQPAAVN